MGTAAGFTGRANSVAVHGNPGCTDDEALTAVVDFYHGRGLPARAQVIVGSHGERVCPDAGGAVLAGVPDGAIVQVSQMADALAEASAADEAEIVLESTASDTWMRGYHRVENPETAPRCRNVRIPSASSRSASLPSAALSSPARGRHQRCRGRTRGPPAGLAAHIIDASRRWAAVRGADKIYLQTIRECTAAPRSMRRTDSATITNSAT